jgi:hypothetical protein
MMAYDDGVMFEKGYSATDASYAKMMPTLSVRNIMPPQPGVTTGNTVENFEVTDYNASVETNDRTAACKTIFDLKPLPYVIFENSNESDTSCNFSFKVEHAHVEEVLGILKALNPKNISENIYTVKRQLDDFTNETSILKAKLVSIDETLRNALKAYDDITVLATKTQDVASLARIIDSKIQIIERLTQERLNVSAQLDRISRAKAEQLDRLDYAYFTVNIYESKYLDGRGIRDSWKAALQSFVLNVNHSLQNATLNLIAFFISLIPYLISLVVFVFAAKYGWKAAKNIWQK